MQIRRHQQTGSLLITAAICAAIISILIGGMLTFLTNEFAMEIRAHRWNQSLYLCEAGVEMAFAEFNTYYVNGNGFQSSRGWTNAGGGQYVKYVPDYRDSQSNIVGSVYAIVDGIGSANPWIWSYGWCPVHPNGSTILWRRVDACLQASASFPVGVAARSHVKLSNNPTTDSYNSATNQAAFARPDYTNATGYVLANGDIATNGSITNDDDIVVNGNVHGRALTGPNGTVSLGGYIGPFLDQAQQTTSISVAETNGWVRHDFAVDFPLPNLPANFNPVTLSGTTLGNGDYTATSLGNSDYTVTGNARLRLTGTGTVINFSGQKGITIQPGGRLEIYTYGNVDLTGQAAINNNTKKPAYCLIYGMGTCSNINVKGNGQIATAIYAPNAAIQWQGAGSKSDFYGGMIGRSVDFQGSVHMDFHYDESLRDLNGTGGRTINSWKSWRYTGSTWVQD